MDIQPPVPEQKTSFMKQAFSAFLLQPKGIRFESQLEKETIFLLLRRHFITNVPWILAVLCLLIAPPIFLPILLEYKIIPSSVTPMMILIIVLIWYLFTTTYALINFLLWYFSVSIITNQRVIDIDFHNILYKEFSATTIGKIEDVTNRRGGFFGVLFDFGDVIVQTAATKEVFEFYSVPHPDQIVRIINTLMEKEIRRSHD